MKTSPIIIIAVTLIFCCSSVSIADESKDEPGKGYPAKSQYSYDDRSYEYRHDYRGGFNDRDRREYKGRRDYHKYPGYRERPYDKYRHYEHRDYEGRWYIYHGHWRSWDQWDRYRRRHPEIQKHGRYYREGGHLMFRFCDPDTGNCFFFSIGR